ncbi:MAG: hypothetical protein QXZ11_05300 [Thermoproteota archaeon]
MEWLEKQGRSEATIANYIKMLRLLVKSGCNLEDPDIVREFLARSDKSQGWRNFDSRLTF